MQETIKSALEISSPAAKPDYVSHRERLDSISRFASLSWRNLASLLSRWYGAFRSSLAHMRIQSPKMSGWVDLGPLGRFQHGHHQNLERIRSRAEGIKMLRTNFPWVDSVDIRMFLMGFDLGEKCSTAVKDHRIDNSREAQQRQY
jgi:hypothetical protein